MLHQNQSMYTFKERQTCCQAAPTQLVRPSLDSTHHIHCIGLAAASQLCIMVAGGPHLRHAAHRLNRILRIHRN